MWLNVMHTLQCCVNYQSNDMIPTDFLLEYYERTNRSTQWEGFNQAFASEISTGLPSEEICKLFFRIGSRMAKTLPVARCDTLDELQAAFNARLQAIGWGFSSLHVEGEYLYISHACSPLAISFGPASGPEWTSSFFEGVYQTWFESQGVTAGLHVCAEAMSEPSPSQILLKFGKAWS